MRFASLVLIVAVCTSTNSVILAAPASSKRWKPAVLAIRRHAAGFQPARRRWQGLHAAEFRRGQTAAGDLHLQPLPDGAGLRVADRSAPRRLYGWQRGSALVAISAERPLQAVRLDEARLHLTWATPSKTCKICAKQREFKFPYLYDGGTRKKASYYLRRSRDAAGLSIRRAAASCDIASEPHRRCGSEKRSPATTRETRSMPCWRASRFRWR